MYKWELDFISSAKVECAGIVQMVCMSIMPQADSSKDPYEWCEENKLQLAMKLKEVYRGWSPWRAEQLDQAIVILEEINGLLYGTLSRLAEATEEVNGLYLQERYEMVAREVIHARFVIGKSKLLVQATV